VNWRAVAGNTGRFDRLVNYSKVIADLLVNPKNKLKQCKLAMLQALALYGQMKSNSFADHTFYQLKMIRSLENKKRAH
jgi:hypothetical protein